MSTFRDRVRNAITSRWLPWIIVIAILISVFIGGIYQPISETSVSWSSRFLIGIFSFSLLVLLYQITVYIFGLIRGGSQVQKKIAETNALIGQAYQRVEAIFHLNQKLVEAGDENDVISMVLRLFVEQAGAIGASFVPIDEYGRPHAIMSHGEIPLRQWDSWVENLASSDIQARCQSCNLKDTINNYETCPLMQGPFESASRLLCLPLRLGEREFGVINLFMPTDTLPDDQTRSYMRNLVDELALGLEAVRLRRREQTALRQMQILRQKTDLIGLLTSLLENVHRTLEADFSLMVVPQVGQKHTNIDLVLGDFPTQARSFIDGILHGVMASGDPVLLGDLVSAHDVSTEVKALMAASLLSPEHTVLGAILVGNCQKSNFNKRHLALLTTVAGQVALVVNNANLVADLEYKTLIQERTRLAREIHDGLAQTLGFLKLRAAQMRGYLSRNEIDQLSKGMESFYAALGEAYQDARQAIDGLRIYPVECGLSGWLVQTVEDFKAVSNLDVKVQEITVQSDLPSEVHAQLIRIVQEAFSNIRKHAHASQVWLACREDDQDIILEIRDDGDGFAPEDISTPSSYGLRGMRERADLIGADLQVISDIGHGTIIRVRLPLDTEDSIRLSP